ncbi:MAG: hypothetical protein CME65_08060 [Halobacteriovoraceae bacterium]|nr:hypothetical protein [Halobacteriovoraceae bacterium]|tara:strand:- start:3276 stop:3860 length:585 start_codon:yes stop_codon:yes gene_type:complete
MSKRTKNILKYSAFIMLAVVFVGVGYFLSQDLAKRNKIETTKSSTTKTKTIDRIPSSIKSSKTSPTIPKNDNIIGKRVLIGDKFSDKSKLKFINSVNPDWQKIYTKKLLRLGKAKPVSELKIDHQKSLIQVKKNSARNLEHIKVSYLDESGNPFAFEALVDSHTGSLVRSWNQTRYEFKKPLSFSAEGTAFYKD